VGYALPGTAKSRISPCPQAYGSIRCTFGASAGLAAVIFFRRRIRLAGLVPNMWRLPECMRNTLPVEEILNRFAAPRCVLSFCFLAMCLNPFLLEFLRGRAASGHATSGLSGGHRRSLCSAGAFFRRKQRH